RRPGRLRGALAGGRARLSPRRRSGGEGECPTQVAALPSTVRRAAVAPGPKFSRYERPRAERRSRPGAPTPFAHPLRTSQGSCRGPVARAKAPAGGPVARAKAPALRPHGRDVEREVTDGFLLGDGRPYADPRPSPLPH